MRATAAFDTTKSARREYWREVRQYHHELIDNAVRTLPPIIPLVTRYSDSWQRGPSELADVIKWEGSQLLGMALGRLAIPDAFGQTLLFDYASGWRGNNLTVSNVHTQYRQPGPHDGTRADRARLLEELARGAAGKFQVL